MMIRGYVAKGPEVVWVQEKRYGCLSFLFDVLMTILTSGFWLIWIFIREMRKR